ncbi:MULTISPECIES: hypothetical protein [Rhizobium]|jgi:hypothetical protein|uniref:Uncharacterized protein n=1 Tax=Rhizobium etli bv. mimosae str. IE4771 TaxID=1432050 RepID=A0A060IH13_RHIET|nr:MULTISPECIES: hypothetical protein [Rhizobium]AIC31240.1 hypothetical protein IE4771_PE00014 [Rhizobium sp. IE4771]AJC83219.1 hypothetical protein IE4803_PD00014 [Rhizobium etli bv. phaseoli str. IE4803]ARQ62022.1 hypothetical protein Kim5_PD00014 [Rhizobium sp. Kim5]UWU37339.1 hypothetical protein N2597_22100 [Rhizobium leguminosarum bv. phaseoli]
MAIAVETGVSRHDTRRATGNLISQLRHAAGICTIVGSFTFLFALVIGLIQ